VTTGSCFIAPAGGVHGTLGDGDAPAAPFTRGGLPHPTITVTAMNEVAWKNLVVCDIIPNTAFKVVLLIFIEGFVRGPVELHLAIRIDTRTQ
jgi:hypothetical protein